MTRNDAWLLATVLALAAPSVFAGQPPQRTDPPTAAATESHSNAQSPIGRALAGLLQRASTTRTQQPSTRPAEPSGSIATASGDVGVASPGMQHADANDAAVEASGEQVVVH